jgi:hypothetical protein
MDFLKSAQKTVALKQFTFTHPLLLDTVMALHKRGVRVRVRARKVRFNHSARPPVALVTTNGLSFSVVCQDASRSSVKCARKLRLH